MMSTGGHMADTSRAGRETGLQETSGEREPALVTTLTPEVPPERSLPAAGWSGTLDRPASKVGSILGGAVRSIRSGKAGVRTLEQRLEDRIEELGQGLRRRISDLPRERARVQREYPVQIILACAAVAFVAGVALRIWRTR